MLKALLLDNFDTQNNAIITPSLKQIVDLRNSWVHATIQPDRIFWELCKHAFNNPSTTTSDYEILNFYAMNSNSVHNQRLIKAFCSLYPNIFNELEKLRKNMPGEMEGVERRSTKKRTEENTPRAKRN
jgi:hypothetical protein